MKKLVLILASVSLSTTSFCQSDFRKGYIVTNNADTLRGLIAYEEGAQAYRSCTFKASEEGANTTYTPAEIKVYGFEHDKVFESHELRETDEPAEKLFLEVIARGLVSLFKADKVFWVNKNGEELHKLVNSSESGIIGGTAVIRYGNEHVRVLNMLLSDCPELRSRIPKIQLAERPLTNLVSDYNRCKGVPVVVYKSAKPWTKVVGGIILGANLSSIAFESDLPDQYLTGSFELSKTPAIGLSVEASSPRISERFGFHTDLTYLTTRYYSYKADRYDNTILRNYTTITIEQLKLPLGVIYHFAHRNITPYICAGMSYTFHLSKSSKWVLEVESDKVVQTFQSEALKINNNQHGIWGGFGVTKSISSRFDASVGVRYEETKGIVGSVFDINKSTTSKVGNIQILITVITK